jgi:hypothetical protein
MLKPIFYEIKAIDMVDLPKEANIPCMLKQSTATS